MKKDFNPFKTIETKSSKAAIRKLNRLASIPERQHSPVRGCFRKWYGRDEYLYNSVYMKWVNWIIKYIEESVLPEDGRESLLVWEKFQSTQKGPCAPVDLDVYDEKILKGFEVPEITLAAQDLAAVQQCVRDLGQNYLKSGINFSPSSVRFDQAWQLLPNTTFRGYPYHAKGKEVDPMIVKAGGSSLTTALKYFNSTPGYLLFPGFRISGSPLSEAGKLRAIFMPPVSMQYIEQGLATALKSKLANHSNFVAWTSPDVRTNRIVSMIDEAEKRGCTLIQLDYSKYDKHWHPIFQLAVLDVIIMLSTDGKEELLEWRKKYEDLLPTQGVFLPNLESKCLYWKLPYQWASGKILTQMGGSFVNVILQSLIWHDLSWGPFPYELAMALGDDAGFPVPTSVLGEQGYENVLTKIAEVLGKYGFKLNPTKAYPNTDLAFLQKLYVPTYNILGVGSFTRALASFIWKEKLNKHIEGVKRYWAMDIISQISILSEPFAQSPNNIHGVADYIVGEWTKIDKYLVALLSVYKNGSDNPNPNGLFDFIVKLAGSDVMTILEYMDKRAYDHSGLKEKLESADKGITFPILNYLLKLDFHYSKDHHDLIQKLDGPGQIEDVSSLLVDEESLGY